MLLSVYMPHSGCDEVDYIEAFGVGEGYTDRGGRERVPLISSLATI